MKIAVASLIDYTNSFPAQYFKSKFETVEKKIAEIALQIDESIYLNNNEIDIVYCLFKPVEIYEPPIPSPNTVYFVKGIDVAFYCRPEVFSIIGNAYKSKYYNEQAVPFGDKKWLCFFDLIGLDHCVV